MTRAKSLLMFFIGLAILNTSYSQFENDSMAVPKNAVSLNVTPILRLSGSHDDQGWFGLVYRRKIASETGRIKVQFNQFEDTYRRTERLMVFQDSIQATESIKHDMDSYQVGIGYEFGKFYKRFHWYSGLEAMWMQEKGNSEHNPLYRFSSDYYVMNPLPVGSGYYGDKSITEMDSSLFQTSKWKRNYMGLGIPLGLSARISSHFEVSAQWMFQFWILHEEGESTNFFSNEVTSGKIDKSILDTRSGELLLTYQF